MSGSLASAFEVFYFAVVVAGACVWLAAFFLAVVLIIWDDEITDDEAFEG